MNTIRTGKKQQMKPRLRLHWGKVRGTGDDVRPARLKLLTRKVQQIYGISRDQADWLLSQWRRWQPMQRP